MGASHRLDALAHAAAVDLDLPEAAGGPLVGRRHDHERHAESLAGESPRSRALPGPPTGQAHWVQRSVARRAHVTPWDEAREQRAPHAASGGSSTTRASRLSSWMTRAPPQASTDGPYPRSPRLRWKLPGPGRLPAPVSARIRPHQHRLPRGPLLAPTDANGRTRPSRRVMRSTGARPRLPPHRASRTPRMLRPFRRCGKKKTNSRRCSWRLVIHPARGDVPEAAVGHVEGRGRVRVGKPGRQRSVAPAAVVHASGVQTAQPRRDVEALQRPVAIHHAVVMTARRPASGARPRARRPEAPATSRPRA